MSKPRLRKPYSKFFWSDWRNEMSLRLCSLEARGLWIEMLAIMGISEKYGHLQVGGQQITMQQLGVMAGCTEEQAARLVAELEEKGVFSRDEHGVPFNRRMVREGIDFENAKQFGKMGGNPALVHPEATIQNPEATIQNPEAIIKNLEATEALTPTLKGGVNPHFTKPSLSDLKAYALEKEWSSFAFDAEAFLDHYEANGWRVGKTAMKDWRAAARNWKRNNFGPTKGKPQARPMGQEFQ